MQVRIYGELREQCPDVDLNTANIQQTMAAIKSIHGAKVSEHIMSNPYFYFLVSKDDPETLVPMIEGLLTMSFEKFDLLLIIPEIEGDVYAVVVLGIALFTTSSLAVAVIVAAVIQIAIALVLAALVMLLSPTPEFDSDPSEAQRKDSSLFTGPPNIREQGGSVPLNYGKSLAGGVLISAGLYAEDV